MDDITTKIQQARQAGVSDSEILQYIESDSASNPQSGSKLATPRSGSQPKSFEGFAGNIGKSAVRNVGSIASSMVNVLNPNMEQNTIANLARLGVDTGKLIAGDKSETNRARLVGDFYKNRYGGMENIGNTLYEDPVGVALDASLVAGGAGALAKGAGALSKSSNLARLGGTLTKTGEILDPISQATKLAKLGAAKTGVTAKVGQVGEAIGKGKTALAEFLATKSTKGAGGLLESFIEKHGDDVGKWMVKENIYDEAGATKAMKPLQKKYNELGRSGKMIDPSIYINNLKARALELKKNPLDSGALSLAQSLEEEASELASRVTKDGVVQKIPINNLTDAKSSIYGKVGKREITDPKMLASLNKTIGDVGIQTLDQVAPGTAAIGKKLQALRDFEDIAKAGAQKGKGSQLINAFKPVSTGAMAGFMGGSALPGIGNLTGAAIGAGGAMLATSPTVQRFAAKALTKPLSIPPALGKIGSTIGQTGVVGRTLIPQDMMQQSQGGQQVEPGTETSYPSTVSEVTDGVNLASSGGQDQATQQEQTVTDSQGYTIDNYQEAIDMAYTNGNVKLAKVLEGRQDRLMAREERMMKNIEKQKPLSGMVENRVQLAKSGLRALTELETMFEEDPSKLLKSIIPGQLGARDYDSAAFRAVEGLLRARSGAAIPETEVRRYMKANLPKIGDSKKEIEFKLKAFRMDLNDVANSGGRNEAEDLLNL